LLGRASSLALKNLSALATVARLATMDPSMMTPEMMKAAQDMMSKMSPEDMQNMMKMQQQMMSNPAMMQQAQQMMKNPAAQQQAAQQMKNMSAEDLRNNINQAGKTVPGMMAAAAPAAPVSVAAKLKGSAIAVPDDLVQWVEEAETAKTAGNDKFKAADYKTAATKYRDGVKLTTDVLDEGKLSGADKKAVVELKEACQLNLANCNLKLKDWDGAVAECSAVLERAENRKARFRRGDAYTQLGKLKEAREDLQKAVKMDPTDDIVKGKLKAVEAKLGVEVEEIEEIDTSAGRSSSSGGGSSSAPMMPDPATMERQLDQLDNLTPEQIAAQAEAINNLTPEQMRAMGMPEGVDKNQLKMAADMMKGMDKESMKSMAKMAAQMRPQMEAVTGGAPNSGGSSSGGSGSSSGGGAVAPSLGGGLPDMNNMSMDQGMDMMKNMSPDMMKAGMEMMKNMDPAMMKSMSKAMGREIDESQLEQMQKMMSNMKPEDMQKWAGRAQKVMGAASVPMAAYKKVRTHLAKVGNSGAVAILVALLAIMSLGHFTGTF